MNEKQFEKMDNEWMKATKDVREKKVSDGILKGFSASVERRILGAESRTSKRPAPAWPAGRLAWVPAMAVLVIASVVVLRSPMMFQPTALIPPTVDYAQLPDTENIDAEIAALKEVGAWNDADDALLGAGDEAEMEALELSGLDNGTSNIA